jgi:hypothetical protein
MVQLLSAGLGMKEITFRASDDAASVNEKLLSEFPLLQGVGGFKLLVTRTGSRTELVLLTTGPVSIDRLKHSTTGRLYIRPLQRDIDVQLCTGQLQEIVESCLQCGARLPISHMRQHYSQEHWYDVGDADGR